MRLSAVLFDLDGTLLDTALDFETALNRLLISEGLESLEQGQIRTHVTNGSAGIIRGVMGIEKDDPDFSRLQQALLANYRSCLTDKTRFFPGIESSLKLLKDQNIRWGLVTNKPVEYAQPIVDKIAPECAVLICPDHVANTKPDPEGMFKAASILNVDPSDCMYVGDHIRDIEASNAAGMISVAANWGYIDNQNEDASDWGADHVVDQPAELATLIRQYL